MILCGHPTHSTHRCGNVPVFTTLPKPTEAPTLYPSNKDGVTHTRLSYLKESIPEVGSSSGGWVLCLPIEIPSDLINPTLKSLVYTIKYATTFDNGDSTVQTDVFLTQTSCAEGVTKEPIRLDVYCGTTAGYRPMVINEEIAELISSVPAIKRNGGTAQWSHYIDHQRLTPNIRVMQSSKLYFSFHAYEYATPQTSRYVAVEASATWLDDLEERKRREEEKGTQNRTQDVAARLVVQCPHGCACVRVSAGYQCGHFLSFQ
jgi:hypothetical protein